MGYLWPAITRVWRVGAGYCRYGSYRLPAYVVGVGRCLRGCFLRISWSGCGRSPISAEMT